MRKRIIPVLLIHKGGLVKSLKFKDYKYVGDPINAVKIFNDKEVDEIIILNIDATIRKEPPNLRQIREIASEAFMPLAYGGGISSIEQVRSILYEGVEKVIFNNSAICNPSLIQKTANQFGSSSTVVSMDIKKNWLGKYYVYKLNGTKNTGINPLEMARRAEGLGAGELFINSIDRDGTFQGFDIDLISDITTTVKIPVIACGGAGSLTDFKNAIRDGGASAVAAGSYFVFQRPHRAVLITYPTQKELHNEIYSQV